MKTETPRTDADIKALRADILQMFPDITGEQITRLTLQMQLIASSAVIDHVNQQLQRK